MNVCFGDLTERPADSPGDVYGGRAGTTPHASVSYFFHVCVFYVTH